MGRRVTIADVAERAGVSYQTVSRVINDKPDVSPDTRRRVQEIIAQTGYRPSRIARSLATARTATIGLVVPDIANPFFSDIALGVEQLAYERNYGVLLCNTNEDPAMETDVLLMLEDKQVDGVIVCGLRQESALLRAALARFRAVVLVNRQLDGVALPAVLVDDADGGYQATRHLLQSGRSEIGFVAGPPSSYSGARRMQGYRQALAEAGVQEQPGWVHHCRPGVDSGMEATRDLLTAAPKLSALFCYNDLVAVGASRACAELGLAVPDDVAIVGFDDIRLAALVSPALTTCRVPRVEMGGMAMEMLLKQIDGDGAVGNVTADTISIHPKLVIRDSAPG
jgi:LacI family transcriptional regulator